MAHMHELIYQLLERQESDELDFKSQQYKFGGDTKKSQFIKDIVAMANTPRNSSAYILIGVKEEAGRATEVCGIDEHKDEATLRSIIGNRVRPTPRFVYHQVLYQGKDLGLIEIPSSQDQVITPSFDFGILREGAVYFRANSANVVATGPDMTRISDWFNNRHLDESHTLDYGMPSGAWDQLYRYCDEFDSADRVFIALVDREPDLDERDWDALARLPWNLVVDFDTKTDEEGNYAVAEDPFKNRLSLQISALESIPEMTSRSTIWVAGCGLKSRPSTKPAEDIRGWNRHKVPMLESTLNKLATITEPELATVIVFGGEKGYVAKTLDIIDRTFLDRVSYVFAARNLSQFEDVAKDYDGEELSVTLPVVCEGIRNSFSDVDASTTEVSFPKRDGGTVAMEPHRANWVGEHLELVHPGVGLGMDPNSNGESFLKGGTISWDDLNLRVDIERGISRDIESQIVEHLKANATRRVNLRHRPGGGASTLARRIAWNLHREYPTVVALEIQPQQTAERIRQLTGLTNLPVLVVIDLPGVAFEEVDRLYDTLRGANTSVVLFAVIRQFSENASRAHYLDAKLTNNESFLLANRLSERVPERRKELESLIHKTGTRRTPFYFGLTAYGRDFKGIESYVETRLSVNSDSVRDAVSFAAFAYYYGQLALPLPVFSEVLGIPRVTLAQFPDLIRELLVADKDNHIRPAHQIIAEEILIQTLVPVGGDRRNWKNGLADIAIRFIDLLSGLQPKDRGKISDFLRIVLINRDSGESSSGFENFSQFIRDIPSSDGQKRVLEHLTDTFPLEPHFWAHLGRFRSSIIRDHSGAHHAYQTAIGLLSDDSLLHHMAGMGWRAQLYDELSDLGDSLSKDDETKIFDTLYKATLEFDRARKLNRRSEYNYISQIQMIYRFAGVISRVKGCNHRPLEFLVLRGNERYRELVDQAQNLLSDLEQVKGSERESEYHIRAQAEIFGLYGMPSEAIQSLDGVLARQETFKPPVRRAIIRMYVQPHEGDWGKLDDRQLARVVELAKQNVEEEPNSDYNLRLWLRAVRTENALSIDRVAEQLAYKRFEDPSLDTTYYLYIMKFLQLESGDLAVANEIGRLIDECSQLAQHLPRTTTAFEWLGTETGLAALAHSSTLGGWDERVSFYSNTTNLRQVRGRISEIRNQGSGYIEMPSGLRAFFVPSRGGTHGGYIRQDVGKEVEFFLGFSYDGLRAWSVHDPVN